MGRSKKIVVSSVATIFLILLYVIIFIFSNQEGEASGGLSQMITEKCVQIWNTLTHRNWSELMIKSITEYFEHPIRKMAHFCEYAVMAGLLFCIWYPWIGIYGKRVQDRTKWYEIWYVCPLLVRIVIPWVFVSASLDEIHQLFVPGRCGNFWDILLDTSGGCFGLFCCIWGCKHQIFRKRCRKSSTTF